jgi:hypothetical protein
MLTSACCWLLYVKKIFFIINNLLFFHSSWLCFYLHQWKPLFGPQLESGDARALRELWGEDF